jgi:hypothetical protein
LDKHQTTTLDIYNTSGKLESSTKFEAQYGDNIIQLETSDLSAGIYIVVIKANEFFQKKTFLKE